MYTFTLEQAIQAAALLHENQTRKGDVAVPYITHLMAVTMILRDYTGDENTLVAALLHDTLEDTEYTAEEMREDFGEDITNIVLTVTEPRDADTPWLRRKLTYAKQVKHGSLEAVLVAAADKIHNFRNIIDEYHDDHQRFAQDFYGDPEERLEGYQAIANAINSRLKDGIVHEFNHTFDLFKQFLIDVQENQIR